MPLHAPENGIACFYILYFSWIFRGIHCVFWVLYFYKPL